MVNLAYEALDPWEDGTKVYKDFGDSGWIMGSVSWFEPLTEMYFVVYEDGSAENYSYDSTVLDALVDNASNYVGYPAGTPVKGEFEEGWFTGTIIDFDVRKMKDTEGCDSSFPQRFCLFVQNWVYSVQWDDGEISEYETIQDVDEIVEFAKNGTPSPGTEMSPEGTAGDGPYQPVEEVLDPWEVGTHVYKEIDTSVWILGTISWFDEKTNKYVILYDDGSSEMFPYDSTELDQLVDNADNYVGYLPGTPVMREFADRWHSGSIITFDVRNLNIGRKKERIPVSLMFASPAVS